MHKNEQEVYLAPEIEMYVIATENGIAISNMEHISNMEQIGDEYEAIEW